MHEGTSTNFLDYSGNAKDFPITNNNWVTKTTTGAPVHTFNGSDTSATATNVAAFEDGYTLMCWIKVDTAATGNDTIIISQNAPSVTTYTQMFWNDSSGDRVRFDNTSGGNNRVDTNVSTVEWHFLAGNIDTDGKWTATWVDMVPGGTATGSTLNLAAADTTYIGTVNSGGLTNFFDGIIEGIVIVEETLTEAQIKDHYRKTYRQ